MLSPELLTLLTKVFRNQETHYRCQNPEILLNALANFFGPAFVREYNQSPINFFTAQGVDLHGIRAIFTKMALNITPGTLDTFENFNQLLAEQPEFLNGLDLPNIARNQGSAGLTPFQIKNLVLQSENPFISLIHLTNIHRSSKHYGKQAEITFENRYKNLASAFVMANNHLFSGQLIEKENRAYAAFNHAVVNVADKKIPNGSLVQMLNDNGDTLKLYQTHQLINYKGIRATAFTTFTPGSDNEVEIRAVFHGTHADYSIINNLEKNFPGYVSMVKKGRQNVILHNLNMLAQDIKAKHPQAKIKLSFMGHSLGGTLAQTAAAKWLEEKSVGNPSALYKEVDTVNIFTKCSPKVTQKFNKKAEAALDKISQSPNNNLSLSVYRLTQHGDIVHKIGEEHLLENMPPHQGFYSSLMVLPHEGIDVHSAHGLHPAKAEIKAHQNNLTAPFKKNRTHFLNSLFKAAQALHPIFKSIFNLKRRSKSGLHLKPTPVDIVSRQSL